ncbi:hypothetical protein LXL04_026605 [Taraxacum kok-saghyz]
MLKDLDMQRSNPDAADQGFIGGYFPDLLHQPMFHPPPNATKRLHGTFRLPLGYQMDASYFCKWSVPCGPNSVITFPGAPWLKPWYWWSWPVLPLGIEWHEQRRETLGYDSEMGVVVVQSVVYLGIIAITCLQVHPKTMLWYGTGNRDKKTSIVIIVIMMFCILISYLLPFLVIPRTIHPILGWSLYLIGSFALSCIAIKAFLLPMVAVLTPWMGIIGALLVMACPCYNDGIVRALFVFAYAFCVAPILWISLGKIGSSRRHHHHIPLNEVENIHHLFFGCDWVKWLWVGMGLWWYCTIQMWRIPCYGLKLKLIWNSRNELIFKDKKAEKEEFFRNGVSLDI